jgi:hypothetical protein
MGLNPLLDSVELFAANAAGTGNVTLGALVNPNAFTMAEVNAVDQQQYVFRFDNANGDFEISRCTYTASGPSLSRDVVLRSKISAVAGTGKITIATTTTCRLVITADDAITRQQTLSRSWLVS